MNLINGFTKEEKENYRLIRQGNKLMAKAIRQQKKMMKISDDSNSNHVTNLYKALHENSAIDITKKAEIKDVFISYAHEDKASFVQPLVDELENRHISRWYDSEQQANMWGRSLRKEIDKGISRSRFCIVIFSKSYFEKYWTNKELDGILMKDYIDKGQMLPIWHEIDKEEMYKFSPMLAGLTAFPTQTYTISEICDALQSKLMSGDMSNLESE